MHNFFVKKKGYLKVFNLEDLDKQQIEIIHNALHSKAGDFQVLFRVTLLVISFTAPRVFMASNNHVKTVKDIFNFLNELQESVTEEETIIQRAINAIEYKNEYEKQLIETEIATVFSSDVKYMEIFDALVQSDRIPNQEVPRVALKLIRLLPTSKLLLCQDNLFRLLYFAEQALEMLQEEAQDIKRKERSILDFQRQFLNDDFLQSCVQIEYREPLKAIFQFKLKEKINTGKVITSMLNPYLISPFNANMEEAAVVNLSMVYLVNNCVQFKRARMSISQKEINNLKNTGAITNQIYDRFTEPVLLAAGTSKRCYMEAMDNNINKASNN